MLPAARLGNTLCMCSLIFLPGTPGTRPRSRSCPFPSPLLARFFPFPSTILAISPSPFTFLSHFLPSSPFPSPFFPFPSPFLPPFPPFRARFFPFPSPFLPLPSPFLHLSFPFLLPTNERFRMPKLTYDLNMSS